MTGSYLDASAFTRAPEVANGTSLADQDFGNSGVGIVRGPGQHNVDLALERIFPVKETKSFRFRTEFFNLTNTPQFANPTSNNCCTAANFGQVTTTLGSGQGAVNSIGGGRTLQASVKFLF